MGKQIHLCLPSLKTLTGNHSCGPLPTNRVLKHLEGKNRQCCKKTWKTYHLEGNVIGVTCAKFEGPVTYSKLFTVKIVIVGFGMRVEKFRQLQHIQQKSTIFEAFRTKYQ